MATKKRGRPKKKDGSKTARVEIRFSREEKMVLKEDAAVHGKTLSEYLRQLALAKSARLRNRTHGEEE